MKSVLNPIALKRNKPTVYNAFVRACGVEKGAIDALNWGSSPKVSVAKGMFAVGGKNMCGMNPPNYFNQNGGTVIISSVRVIPLERCVAATDILNNQRAFESTLLHEIVHNVREKNGLIDPNYDFPNTPESGAQFEIWAYGKLQCTDANIDDALLSYM
jgi:hypothetical protein